MPIGLFQIWKKHRFHLRDDATKAMLRIRVQGAIFAEG